LVFLRSGKPGGRWGVAGIEVASKDQRRCRHSKQLHDLLGARDPADVLGAIQISKATVRKMKQNLFWAAF
jgi:hypothetical protein